MFAQVHYPASIDPEELDVYLSLGWFRMGQTIFTTSFLNFKGHFYGAVWLRIDLEKYTSGKTFQKLCKQNSAFRVEVHHIQMSDEKERLYQKYKEAMPFEPSATLADLLLGQETQNIYATYEICIYDENKLIAVGFFDMGKESAAGISSFYDPDYRKFSLGKYLIYLKIEYCRKQQFRYFYPGYFVPDYPLFDYKLEIGKNVMEYWDITTRNWIHIREYVEQSDPIKDMEAQLRKLESILINQNCHIAFFRYDFFDANLVPEFYRYELFDYPQFIYCYDLNGELIQPLIVFDIRDRRYHLLQCISVHDVGQPMTDGGHFNSHVLKLSFVIASTNTAEEMAEKIRSKE